MYTPFVRIIIGLLGIGMAYNFYLMRNTSSTYLVLLAVGLIVWGYFKNGTVYLAFKQLKKDNHEKAEKLLLKIKYPNLLTKSQKSYYHFIKGFIELHKDNLDVGCKELTQALEIGLRTENDTLIATRTLAAIKLERVSRVKTKNK